MKFMRIIIQDGCDAAFNMALDEAVSESVRNLISPPTIRLYRWKAPSVSIGLFQKIREIDIDYCRQRGYPVVRRLTGGRAVLHDRELTYSISAAARPPFRDTLFESYRQISNSLIRALSAYGLKADMSLIRKRNSSRNPSCFRSVSYGEITLNGKKIIGSAQKRFSGGFLQHGSILFEYIPSENSRVLHSAGEFADTDDEPLRCLPETVTYGNLANALRDAFEHNLGTRIIADQPDKSELNRADELRELRYENREWTFRR